MSRPWTMRRTSRSAASAPPARALASAAAPTRMPSPTPAGSPSAATSRPIRSRRRGRAHPGGERESGSVRVLRDAGLAGRLDREGLEHGGIYLQFAGERRHIDFRELTGRTVTVYAQTEVVKDLIGARLAGGAAIEFEISDTEVDAVTSDRPVLR